MSDATSPSSDETRAPHYFWFGGEVTDELRDQLIAAGGGARLEVHMNRGKMWLHVIAAGQAENLTTRIFRPLNHSNECPPFC